VTRIAKAIGQLERELARRVEKSELTELYRVTQVFLSRPACSGRGKRSDGTRVCRSGRSPKGISIERPRAQSAASSSV
jgi:hypothetical protein